MHLRVTDIDQNPSQIAVVVTGYRCGVCGNPFMYYLFYLSRIKSHIFMSGIGYLLHHVGLVFQLMSLRWTWTAGMTGPD